MQPSVASVPVQAAISDLTVLGLLKSGVLLVLHAVGQISSLDIHCTQCASDAS